MIPGLGLRPPGIKIPCALAMRFSRHCERSEAIQIFPVEVSGLLRRMRSSQ
jgi:hypothetical protein